MLSTDGPLIDWASENQIFQNQGYSCGAWCEGDALNLNMWGRVIGTIDQVGLIFQPIPPKKKQKSILRMR